MKNHVLTPEARDNLLDIIDFIAADSPAAADRVLTDFEQAFESLGTNPGMGHYRDDLLSRQHRFHSVYSYLIVYRWQATPIQIVAIVHGARDLGPYFRRHGIG
jgi:plasmid stabilization system protein ParE